MNKVVMKIFPR